MILTSGEAKGRKGREYRPDPNRPDKEHTTMGKTATATKTPKTPKTPKTDEVKKAGGVKKEGLRAPQVRILAALNKATGPLVRRQISEKAPCDLAFLTEYLGSNDPEVRAKNDAKFAPSLITLGFIKFAQAQVDGKEVNGYTITAAGRKALEKATAAAK